MARQSASSAPVTPRVEPTQAAPEKLYLENTLLRVAGALFCHDAKRAPTRVSPIEVATAAEEKRIRIEPHPSYGQPGPLAHKLFVALIKKHSDYGQPIQDSVCFTHRELARLVGREWGNSARMQLKRALYEIQSTFITTRFQTGSPARYFESRFAIFGETTVEIGADDPNDIKGFAIRLAAPIVTSLRDKHFTCLNHHTMMQLGSVGQALYIRLFFHFANIYDEEKSRRVAVTKRYDAICQEWLGGLSLRAHKSLIERDQLGPHLRELKKLGFLASYAIEKTGDDLGFKLTFRPGPAFFTDYERFYRNRQQGELQWHYHGDQADIGEPMQAARLFLEKRSGEALSPLAFVSSADVAAARDVIARVGASNMPAFIDYGLAQARSTRFDVQHLGGLRQYVDGFLKTRTPQTDSRPAPVVPRDDMQADREAYAQYRAAALLALFQSLPADEQAAIDAEVERRKPRAVRGAGPMARHMHEIARGHLLAERYPAKVESFDDWRAAR